MMLKGTQVRVNDKTVYIKPYSELRAEQLGEINADIEEYLEKNKIQFKGDIPRKKIAEWWYRKAAILWECETPLSISFFEDKAFEQGVLEQTEAFFLTKGGYL